jgi:hypothetical protein
MHAAVLRCVLFKNRRRMLADKVELYRTQDREAIERLQVARFDAVWSYCLSDVPFYRSWAREHGLPDRIDRPSDLASFPTLTKQVIVERSDEIFRGGAVKSWVTTGGSTGEPARYPSGTPEADLAWANMYLGRGWWDIRPFDDHVMLWGHAHLFGTGLKGRIAQTKRKGADRVLNIMRLNAYDMTEQALDGHFRRLRGKDPVFMVGYTSAMFRLARYTEANGVSVQMNRLRGVVLTSEMVSDADIDAVERVFRAPAIIRRHRQLPRTRAPQGPSRLRPALGEVHPDRRPAEVTGRQTSVHSRAHGDEAGVGDRAGRQPAPVGTPSSPAAVDRQVRRRPQSEHSARTHTFVADYRAGSWQPIRPTLKVDAAKVAGGDVAVEPDRYVAGG